jgi:hypothetical protein
MEAKKSAKKYPKGMLEIRATITCGRCCQFEEILCFPRNVNSIAAVKAYLCKEKGWELTKKHGWVCCCP